ncbi:uncharacterized protein LOC134837951 [Culicoides brevitarsis]|uniref:uncharacterized protein LOC134837951 n=1 Tax=Culicoides brevitarsis TaxID=469753 RepID=UPI00307B8D25
MIKLIFFVLGYFCIANTLGYESEEYVPFIGKRRDNFDWNLLKNVIQNDPSKNVVISPFSAKIILMLLAEMSGINSQTRKELLGALDDVRDLHEGRTIFSRIIKSLHENDEQNVINCGSRVFITDKVRTSQKLEVIYERSYNAGVQNLDFTDVSKATDTINNFVAEVTHNNLKDFVSRETVTDAIVVLINAIFFNGQWSNPFKTARTQKSDFFVAQNSPKKVDFMHAKSDYYFFHSMALKSSLLRLPYAGNKYAMFIILPDIDTNLNSVLSNLDTKIIHREMWYLDEQEVNLQLPKFKISYPMNLKPLLMNMGITTVFSNNASLPLLARGDQTSTNQLLLSQIQQHTGIEVNEQGSVAFAATQAQLVNKIGGGTKEFKANRPFLFYIEDEKTGNILFAGKVSDPSICLIAATIAAEVDREEYVPFQGRRFDEFDWQLSKSLMEKSNGNVVISPFSVKILLMLLAEASGIDTPTFNQLSVILPNIRVPYDGRELFKNVIGSFNSTQGATMKTGTKIYMNKDIKTLKRYADIAKKYYDTSIEYVDFSRQSEVATQINNWCANVTENHIQNFISQDALAEAVVLLLNAVYFKGQWRQPFQRDDTFKKDFEGTTKKSVEFMKKTENFYYFDSSQLKAKILRLPYANTRYAMFFILPKQDSNINELIQKLDSKTISREAWYLDEMEVKVEIPKFKYEFDGDLKTVLQQIGIKDIFNNNASLPLLFSDGENEKESNVSGHKVSNILQKAGIIVDEEGSTAYAATQVQIVNKFGALPVEFIANRPFVFFIEDEATGTILFAGKVADPTRF